MTKKARRTLERQQATAAAAEAEKISYAESKEAKSRRLEERLELIKNMQEEIRLEKFNVEQGILLEQSQSALRKTQLENTLHSIHEIKNEFEDYVNIAEEEESWFRYLACDGLPDVGKLPDMNTFMFLWTMEDEEANIDTLTSKCKIVTHLLSNLNDIINFSVMRDRKYIEECKLIREEFRKKLQQWIDLACYRLLRQIDRDMDKEDIKYATYETVSEDIICCLWALIKLPIALEIIPEKDRRPIDIYFEQLELRIRMPLDVDCYSMAFRMLWVRYDHYSDKGTSHDMPQLPKEYETTIDLLDYCQNEYETIEKIREEQIEGRRLRFEEKKAILERMENPPAALPAKSHRRGRQAKKISSQYGRVKRLEPELEPESLPYLPTPNEIILLREEEARKAVRKLLFTRCEKTEINLRKYKILGGIFHVDLVYQPPQPKEAEENVFLTTLQVPKELKRVPFSKPYKALPPAPDSERTPEVIEAEMKALETAMEALALITLKLPSTVLWFEPPLVAHWVPERRIWSTQDVHDIKYNEERQQISFRTGRLGIHGLAAYKFINLPFQSWEMKPEMGRSARGGVVLNITAATVQAEFIVREDLVSLNSLAGGTSDALQDIVGQYMRLYTLIEKMREGGCDLFPERDAQSYMKGLPMKHSVTEKHLQECIGLFCTAYSFSWSRWNATRSPREIVLQYKELYGCDTKERTNVTVLVTPLRAIAVQCTEVSPEFSDVPVDGDSIKYYADLYNLLLFNAGIKSRLMIKNISFKLVLTVAKLLQHTNVISMSS